MIFDALGVLALGEVQVPVTPEPVEPTDEILDPLEVDACFTNDEILSVYGGENPYGIPNWTADPLADPVEQSLDTLDVDATPSPNLTYSPITPSQI